MTFVCVILIVLGILAAVLLTAAWLLYRVAFATGKTERGEPILPRGDCYAAFRDQMAAETAYLKAQPFEQVSIAASDGTELVGRYYHVADSAPLMLFFHGWRGHALRDGCIGFQICQELQFNLLLVDQRGHGRSGGKCTTMGVKEREDCVAWARWAAQRWPERDMVLMGVSMGGATVLMAAEQGLPDAVKAIIADCGFTSPREILRACVPVMLPGLPAGPCYAIGRLGARLFVHFDPNQADARTALAACPVPVLFLHGEADSFVPCEMSRENYAACTAPKRLVTFPGAPHAASYYADPDRYLHEVSSFLNQYLPEWKTVPCG